MSNPFSLDRIGQALGNARAQAARVVDQAGEAAAEAGQAALEFGDRHVTALRAEVAEAVGRVDLEALDLPLEAAERALNNLAIGAARLVGLDPQGFPTTATPRERLPGPEVLDDPARQEAVLAALPPGEAERYEAVAAALGNDRHALVALQELALSGKLAANDLGRPPASLLANLEALAGQQTPANIDRQALLRSLVRELADPVAIEQGERNTCGATTAQILMATRFPAELARLTRGLASPAGVATTQNGQVIRRDEAAIDNLTSKRTLPGRLLQPAFMSLASYTGRYSDRLDGNTTPDLPPEILAAVPGGQELRNLAANTAIPGLLPTHMPGLLHDLTGQGYGLDMPPLNAAWRQGTASDPVPVLMNFMQQGHTGVAPHWVQVVGHGPDYVDVLNPWGQADRIKLADFENHLMATVAREG